MPPDGSRGPFAGLGRHAVIRTNSTAAEAILGGLAGAVALTALHETARRLLPAAPRMDILGRRALAKGLEAAGIDPPGEDSQQAIALAGDLASNTLYYSLIGVGSPAGAPLRGALLGAAAGLGAVVLPPYLGLGKAPRGLTPEVKAMTVAWYTVGGLVAGLAARALGARRPS